MDKANTQVHPAEMFVREFSRQYFEVRNFEAVKSNFHENISWYGTGAHEVCRNMQDAFRLIDEEGKAWDGKFKITKQHYDVYEYTDNICLVTAEIEAMEDGFNIVPIEMQGRISVILQQLGDSYKALHVHFSVPNVAQEDGEFMHKTMVENYDRLLEEKLVERTNLLKQKSLELERLTNNIRGGVQICLNDKHFTTEYISTGFVELLGFTLDELKALYKGCYAKIIHSADIERVRAEITRQLEALAHFSLEYRVLHKDGHYLWVLDNGASIEQPDGKKRIQSILTDITAQKEQENLLRISEKRYETAMMMSDIVMFEYNIVTKQLILFERDIKLYNVDAIVDNGVETFISDGIIQQESVADFREMYRKIHAGVPSASCYVHAKDALGGVHEYELSLNTVFDDDGVPQRAVGVRRNVSQMRKLEREQEFSKALVLGKTYVFEANITENTVVWMNDYYIDALDLDMNLSYSDIIQCICDRLIAPEWRESVTRKTSCKYIQRKYDIGERLIMFSYKRKDELGEIAWYEATISIMFDTISQHLHMRFYNSNINERKEKEQRAAEERRIYETMTSRSSLVYEVNISQNAVIKGNEKWNEQYGIEVNDNYSDMMLAFSQRAIFAEDGPLFAATFNRERLEANYILGEHHINCQYRRPNEQGELRWVSCTLHLYEDPETGDIKGYIYVEDIDLQKRAELELKYNAEHDGMTTLLNKATTEASISEYLAQENLSGRQHALLIVDIDYFKSINDTFGHLFGDDVLREIAEKLQTVFRDEDIIGRIGGDEFAVLMKNTTSQDAAMAKASEVCRLLALEYNEAPLKAAISASIGIAFFPHHGLAYDELVRHADAALYNAKSKGRNTYSV